MKRTPQYLQAYRHAWRDAIAFVADRAKEMDDPSARAALNTTAFHMGLKKHGDKKRNAPDSAPQHSVEDVEFGLTADDRCGFGGEPVGG
jgi:hypothetical protein